MLARSPPRSVCPLAEPAVHSPHLRVTRRCLVDDLGLNPELLARDARHYCAEHEALKTFVVKREGAPGTGEPIKDVGRTGSVLSLHVGQGRAATIWDEEADVCWLLAWSPTHAIHERRDAYQLFMKLHGRGELMPTADDYEAIDLEAITYIADGLSAACDGMYEEARANPGSEMTQTFENRGALILVDVIVIEEDEMEEGWIAITYPRDTPITAEVALDLCARILPAHIPAHLLTIVDHFGKRPMQPGELIFSWDYANA